MEQLQHEVHVLMVANVIVACGFGFIIFCWFCELANKWLGITDSSNSHKRRIQQRQAEKEEAFRNAVAAAVAEQIQQLQPGGTPAGGTSP